MEARQCSVIVSEGLKADICIKDSWQEHEEREGMKESAYGNQGPKAKADS